MKIDADNSIVIKKSPVLVANMSSSVQQEEKLNIEQCNLCSCQYEKPRLAYPQPDLNRLICKVLQVAEPPAQEDGTSYFSQYIPVCSSCTNRVREYDKKRIALDILRQEIVTSVVDTLIHIRPTETTPLHRIKHLILKTSESQWPTAQVQQTSPVKPSTAYSRNLHGRRSPILVRPGTGNSPAVKTRLSTLTIMRKGSAGKSTETETSAAVKSILQTTTSDGRTSWVPVTISGEGEQPWNVSGEVSVYSGENDSAPQQITEYVAQHIYVEQSQDEEGGEDYDDQGHDDDPIEEVYEDDEDINETGDPGVDKDPDYKIHKSNRKKSDRKQMLVSSATKNDQPKLLTVKLVDLASNKGTEKKPRRRTHRSKSSGNKPPYFCPRCGSVFSRTQNLNLHVKVCTGDNEKEKNSKICSIDGCSQDFSISGWAGLKAHIDSVHPDIVLEKCRFCRSEFLPNNFQYHDCATIPELKNYACDYCDKVYHTSNSVSEHIRRRHDNGRGKTYPCTTCGKSFKSNSILFYHMSTHQMGTTAATPFACDLCGVCTTTRWGLQEHKKVHTGEKPFTCQICHKKFRIRSILKNHMAIHTGEKNFKCEICDKPFALYCTMLRHWKLHINPKPPIGEHCPLCPNGGIFKKNKTLKEHMLFKHPGTKEQFEICSRPLDADELAAKSSKETKNAKVISGDVSQDSVGDESEGEIEEVLLSGDEAEKVVAKSEVITYVVMDEVVGETARMNTRFHGKKRALVHDSNASPPSKQKKT